LDEEQNNISEGNEGEEGIFEVFTNGQVNSEEIQIEVHLSKKKISSEIEPLMVMD